MWLIPTTVLAQDDSRGAPPMMPPPALTQSMQMPPPMVSHATPMQPGLDRWAHVPGGWSAYRALSYGYRLPPH